ncbi:hypothetical protein AVU32_gp036 [Vibrio phage ValKK3]|uniref:Uncharacterized protein n=1 Tax=Vibrio phage ValKK3 TaxID=1610855 RepID=A0A0D4DB19_9CAUD|nr:hypothetical protein AVU32_gp036 [Vibrio phage ValKK3]AJT60877.1 hypothetical protein [Vibrio phage ValKK3]
MVALSNQMRIMNSSTEERIIMKNTSIDNDLKWVLNLLIAACVIGIAFIACLTYSSLSKSDTVLRTLTTDYGKVVSVSSCDSRKHSIDCLVRTDKYNLGRIRVTDYPGDDMIYVGDKIFLERRVYEDRVETRKGRNGYTVRSSVCYSWMPCFDKYDNK